MFDWQTYSAHFRAVALQNGFDRDYIEICLHYAFSLNQKQLPIIYDQEHLASLVGYDLAYLRGAIYATKSFYRTFSINKKAGGLRQISEPLPSLKEIQRWILDNLLYRCAPSKFAKGFVPRLSIRDNARFHRGQKLVLSLDIKDFFSSIKAPRVYKFFFRLGYQRDVAHLLTNLCILDGALPQGAPTSPALSNLIILRTDRRLSGFALNNKLRYTRYADDITFSGDFKPVQIIKLVRKVLADEGLVLNEQKTRLMERHQRQEVTGVVVNSKLQAPRYKRREFRQTIYYINKYGVDSHLSYIGNEKANYLKYLLGVANYFLYVNPKDMEVRAAIELLHRLLRDTGGAL